LMLARKWIQCLIIFLTNPSFRLEGTFVLELEIRKLNTILSLSYILPPE